MKLYNESLIKDMDQLYFLEILEEEYGIDNTIEICRFLLEKGVYKLKDVYISEFESERIVEELSSERKLFSGNRFMNIEEIIEDIELSNLHILLLSIDAVVGKKGYNIYSIKRILEKMGTGQIYLAQKYNLEVYIQNIEVFSYYIKYEPTKKKLAEKYNVDIKTINHMIDGYITKGVEERRKLLIETNKEEQKIIEENFNMYRMKKRHHSRKIVIKDLDDPVKKYHYEIYTKDYENIKDELRKKTKELENSSKDVLKKELKKIKKRMIRKYGKKEEYDNIWLSKNKRGTKGKK